jgi:hypothetical protein
MMAKPPVGTEFTTGRKVRWRQSIAIAITTVQAAFAMLVRLQTELTGATGGSSPRVLALLDKPAVAPKRCLALSQNPLPEGEGVHLICQAAFDSHSAALAPVTS